MADKRESRREYLTLAALNPADQQLTAEVMISYDLQNQGAFTGMAMLRRPTVFIRQPTAIFEGLTWDEDEDRRGYGAAVLGPPIG